MNRKERVNIYVDGFNLYRGMTDRYKDTKWLNLYSLSLSFLKHNQMLNDVNFYTARIKKNPEKQRRQKVYLQALEANGVKIIEGQYQAHRESCRNCKNVWLKYKEKMTDVNIATAIIRDAYKNVYDVAIVVSGDSDLMPPIKAVKEDFKNKLVGVAFPPNRHSVNLKEVVHFYFTIGRKKLKDHQLPLEITKADGYVLHKPEEWD